MLDGLSCQLGIDQEWRDSQPSGSATNIGSPSGNFVSEVLLLVAHGLSSAQSLSVRTFRNITPVVGRTSVVSLIVRVEFRSLRQPPTRPASARRSHTLITQMPFHLDVDRAVHQHSSLGPTHALSSLDSGTKHWPEDLGSIPIYRQRQLLMGLRLSFRINVPHKSSAWTVAGEECSKPTADRHALPSKNNLSPLGSTDISSEVQYDVQGGR